MKFKQLLEGLLLEASAKDILMTKAGLNERNADLLVATFGKVAIKIFNKILAESLKLHTNDPNLSIISGVTRYPGETLKDKLIEYFNDRRTAIPDYFGGRNEMNGLRDYIRVALNGNYSQIENLTIPEMVTKAKEWHEEMGGGTSDYNYEEDKDIILDFRKDGVGYYWADLGTKQCDKEAERMGHCASSAGYLYSLRAYKKIDDKHTLNKSVLTASITPEGEMLQLKGASNSKPKEEYFPYIYDLLLYKDGEGNYLINEFGCEYNCHNDFQVSDLSKDEIIELYKLRPELFQTRKEKNLLFKLGIIERNKEDGKFILSIDADEIKDYLRNGDEYRRGFFGQILMGDTYEFWDNSEYANWEHALEYETNQTNSSRIKEMIQKLIPDTNFDDVVEALKDLEDDDGADEIIRAIRWSVNQAESDDYGSHLYSELKNALSEYGRIIELNDSKVDIEIDLYDLTNRYNISDETLDEAFEACGDDHIKCVFEELLYHDDIEKPRYDISDYYSPDMDNGYYNEILSERLDEI